MKQYMSDTFLPSIREMEGIYLFNCGWTANNDCRTIWYRLLKENHHDYLFYDMSSDEVSIIAEIALKAFPMIYGKDFQHKGKRRKSRFRKYPVSFDEISVKLAKDKDNIMSILDSFRAIEKLDNSKCFAHNVRYAFCYLYIHSSIENAESFLETYLNYAECPFGSRKNISSILKAVNSVEIEEVPFELWLNMYEVVPVSRFDSFISRKISHVLCV